MRIPEALVVKLEAIAATVLRARTELDRFSVANASSEAMAILRAVNSRARRASREAAAHLSALAWVEYFLPARAPEDHQFLVSVLRWEEAKGLYGGPRFAPGAGTTRHPAFSRLGKGRRQASDGGAWDAAIWNEHSCGIVSYECVTYTAEKVVYHLRQVFIDPTPAIVLSVAEFVALFTEQGALGVLYKFVGENYADESKTLVVADAADLIAAIEAAQKIVTITLDRSITFDEAYRAMEIARGFNGASWSYQWEDHRCVLFSGKGLNADAREELRLAIEAELKGEQPTL